MVGKQHECANPFPTFPCLFRTFTRVYLNIVTLLQTPACCRIAHSNPILFFHKGKGALTPSLSFDDKRANMALVSSTARSFPPSLEYARLQVFATFVRPKSPFPHRSAPHTHAQKYA